MLHISNITRLRLGSAPWTSVQELCVVLFAAGCSTVVACCVVLCESHVQVVIICGRVTRGTVVSVSTHSSDAYPCACHQWSVVRDMS